jgi:N-carbamoyl-L-amino-acid hydrolase
MRLRHDAGYVAAAITAGVRAIAKEMGGTQVATVGRCELQPNLVNVIAATAVMTVDLRNTDEALLKKAEASFHALCEQLAEAEGVAIQHRVLARFEPVEFDAGMISLVDQTAQRLGHSTKQMPSGAGHDAQMLARVCPTSMIFVESVNGLSHNIAEYTKPADITAGANVLLQVVLSKAAET